MIKEINGILYKAKEINLWDIDKCLLCAFNDNCVIENHPCMPDDRKDHKNVYWIGEKHERN